MKLRRILLTLLFGLFALGAAPLPSAYAGGPTSVLMVNPALQQARAAYTGDSVYAALAAAVGEGQTGPNAAPAGLATGEDIRLTWLIHDMQIWRIDRIHAAGADGIWIETVMVVDVTGEGRMSDGPAHWHRPANEAALTAVLSDIGLLGDSDAQQTNPPAPEAEATVPTPAAVLPRILLAALAGLVVGVAGTLVGVRARSGTPADSGPRVTLSG